MTSVDPSEPTVTAGDRDETASELDSGPRRRGHRLLVAAIVVLALLGAVVIAGVRYYDGVGLPDQLPLPDETTLYYADGTTVLATLGAEHRHVLAPDAFSDVTTQVAVAAADPDFWTDSDSPITRQVARGTTDLRGDDFSTRARLWVLAHKFEDRYGKREILGLYLNLISFGRNAYGIEAAAQTYLGKTVDRSAPAAEQATMSELMVLFGLVDHPEPSISQPGADPGLDPTRGTQARANAVARWQAIRTILVDRHDLTQAQADALVFPDTIRPLPAGPAPAQPVGLVVQHALAELRAAPPFAGKPAGYIENGGFDIVTTLSPRVQQAVERQADETVAGSVMSGISGEQAAAVVVEPGTGRVLAYFGNHDGTGADFAGWYTDETGQAVGYGAHPMGQTIQPYALAAALKQGISLTSRWPSAAVREFPGHTGADAVSNRTTAACQPACTLADAAVAGLDVPFYALGRTLTPPAVLEAVRASGVDDLWSMVGGRHRVGIRGGLDAATVTGFGPDVSLGAVEATVLDQANAMATLAAGGRRASAHVVRSVTQHGSVVYSERLAATDDLGLTPAQVADLDWALSRNPAGHLPGVDSAVQLGVYGTTLTPSVIAHAWAVGYTADLAMAVWIGNKGVERGLVVPPGLTGGEAGVAAAIYRATMAAAVPLVAPKPGRFPTPTHTGVLHPPGAL